MKMKRCNHSYSDWSYDADSRHRVCLECGDVDAEGLEIDDSEFARVYEPPDEYWDCSLFPYQGVLYCSAVGSEMCDWECPNSKDIGKSITNKDSEV